MCDRDGKAQTPAVSIRGDAELGGEKHLLVVVDLALLDQHVRVVLVLQGRGRGVEAEDRVRDISLAVVCLTLLDQHVRV